MSEQSATYQATPVIDAQIGTFVTVDAQRFHHLEALEKIDKQIVAARRHNDPHGEQRGLAALDREIP
jgi:hypothetical protein